MNTPTLRFLHGGKLVTLQDVAPQRTLLEVLREDMQCSGTKEGCGEGDCGACTVVIGQLQQGRLQYRAINSCIRLAHSIDGMALWTVECLSDASGALHPVQQAMLQSHATQCGFCTPGFVMSLFALYQTHPGRPPETGAVQQALAGNLCRCTGYRPIVAAAHAMYELPAQALNEADVVSKLELLAASGHDPAPQGYLAPRSLAELLELRARHPQAQLVAGCTDVGLWVTKQHRQFERIIDITRVQELRRVEDYPFHIAVGAAVPLTDAFAALVADRAQLKQFADRFAAPPVRNSATLGGNVANGSPIGDSMPLLIALGASVVLMSTRGHREMPLEDLYSGYRSLVLADDEIVAWIKVPKARTQEYTRVYKVSKRQEDDISAVCLGLQLVITDGRVTSASIGCGGVAATPMRARRTEQALLGQRWSEDSVRGAMRVLQEEFVPISDMRASAAYRTTLLANLLLRYWLDSQGQGGNAIESVTALEPQP
jgi:xanthine dehydrogenase small subunit